MGACNITEFNYRYAPGRDAQVFLGVKTHDSAAGKAMLQEMLEREGYKVLDMTSNEAAKLHIRYMVGGRVGHLANELLLRFEFPERPGALAKFLDGVGTDWNISLFHYRNHGADYGRVLAGFQVPPSDRPALFHRLEALGYPFEDESQNPAYDLFLA